MGALRVTMPIKRSCYYLAKFSFLCAIIVKGAPKALIIQSLATLLIPADFRVFSVFRGSFNRYADPC